MAMQRKQSTGHLLHQIRQEYVRDESGRLGQLIRLLDEQLCAGDPLPEEWAVPPAPRRQVVVKAADDYL